MISICRGYLNHFYILFSLQLVHFFCSSLNFVKVGGGWWTPLLWLCFGFKPSVGVEPTHLVDIQTLKNSIVM